MGFRRSSLKWRPELLGASALLCAAFLLKQPAAIAAIPLGIYLLLPGYRISRGLTRTQSVVHAAIFTTGFFGSLALFAVFLQGEGIFRETVYWTIVANTIPYIFWKKGILVTLAFVGACLPLVIGVAAAIRDSRGLWAGKNGEQTALLGLLAASAIGTAAGARFYEHYYIQLIPPLSLLAAPYYAQLWTGRMQSPYWLLRPALTYAWLAATIVVFSISHWLGAARRVPSETGRYLLEYSAPNDRIFVWGNKPKIYIEARRRPACRYILSFPLTGYIFGEPPGFDTRHRIVSGAWTTLEQDFEKHPPAYIVDLSSEPSALDPVRDFPILAKLLAERYQPVARTAEGVIYHRNDSPAVSLAASWPPFNLWAQQSEAELLKQARVTKYQAKRIALARVKRGTIKSAELEKENGVLIWSFDVAQPGKKDVTEVWVDATTGKITAVEVETPAVEMKEVAEHKAKKWLSHLDHPLKR